MVGYLTRFAAAALFIGAAACATADANPSDPYEGYNRAVFRFNDKADQYIFSPVARGYRKITPHPVRKSVRNFFNNLRDANSFGSNLLRGHIGKAGGDFMRVAVNSTFGLGGLLDIATEAGMPDHKNTLGDTFASWGWKKSNYFVVPLLGPSTVRDTLGSAVSSAYSVEKPLFVRTPVRIGLSATGAVSQREQLLDTTDVLDDVALDKYSYVRDIYMAVRNKQLGNPAATPSDLIDPEAASELQTPQQAERPDETEAGHTVLQPDSVLPEN